ncbi:MAG: Holliday junction branch migration protein RuvA [Sporocytophaga sp.]|uniref:Holliday junction branch migration protein RuvA n=1 Tax=Sporocytophaga sp. TaxID=2231183 RepID=UPI001B07736F|nr:Holliday junction branch migration protein RuvA [Sporocytophaga sp.]MBO9701603.1 Holliday junction branch migration protein RuvA [Sporocytophaga sp.]
MIAYIEGKLAFKDPFFVIIETNGIGYQIRISLQTYSLIKDEEKVKLHTYLHIKEDAHTLFGFFHIAEKKIFLDLISISGVGPGTAMMIISSLNAEELSRAIVQEDVRTIQSIKGIGLKTAQRIVLELKDKIKKEPVGNDALLNLTKSSHNLIRGEALSALITLGIAKNVAEKSIDSIIKKEGDNISLENLIKQALKTA